jgi:hypothetical protein
MAVPCVAICRSTCLAGQAMQGRENPKGTAVAGHRRAAAKHLCGLVAVCEDRRGAELRMSHQRCSFPHHQPHALPPNTALDWQSCIAWILRPHPALQLATASLGIHVFAQAACTTGALSMCSRLLAPVLHCSVARYGVNTVRLLRKDGCVWGPSRCAVASQTT